MDLRQFFGEWREGQPIDAMQESKEGAKPFVLEVIAFTPDRVTLRSIEDSEPLNIMIESAPQNNPSAYSLEIDSGSNLTPTDLTGKALPGAVLVSPPAPSKLMIHGEMVLSSNTLFTKVNGQIALVRNFVDSSESSLFVDLRQGGTSVKYFFTGMEKK